MESSTHTRSERARLSGDDERLPRRSRQTFRAMSRVVAHWHGSASFYGAFALGLAATLLAMVGALVGHVEPAIPVLLVMMLLPATVLRLTLFRSTLLDVGADGLLLRWLGRRRFVGYHDIMAVSRYEWNTLAKSSLVTGVALTLASGESLLIPVGGPESNISAVEESIREALEAHGSKPTGLDMMPLRRRGRTLEAWVTALRAMGAGADADLRTTSVPHEHLLAILEDPAAPPADRAAAAVALGAAADEEESARLRAAATAVAEPRLRVALDQAHELSDEAALKAALEELDAVAELELPRRTTQLTP